MAQREILKQLLKLDLQTHSWTYRIAGYLATKIEGGTHPKHRLTNYHKFFVDNINQWDTVMDVGCGNGALTQDIAEKAIYILAIDNNPDQIKKTIQNNNRTNIRYECMDILNLNEDQSFNVVILSNVLEHIKNRKELLELLGKKTRKMLIRVPIITRSWLPMYAKEQGLEYRLDMTHETEYTYEDLKDEVEGAGFEITTYSIQYGELWAVVEKQTVKREKIICAKH